MSNDCDWTVVFCDRHVWATMNNMNEVRARQCEVDLKAQGLEAYAVSCKAISDWIKSTQKG